MNYNDKALEALLKSINLAVQQNIETAKFDRTIEGRIIASLPNEKYEVSINGSTYILKGQGSYAVNEVVKILVPQNDFKKIHILPNDSASSSVNIDGGTPSSNYGGFSSIDAGGI